MTSFALKIIALISMIFDHSGYILFHNTSYFNIIGRLAFPIFAFQISEGYKYTKNLKKYFHRLFLFAIISQVPFMLFLSIFSSSILKLNIFFTLLLGLLAITIYDKLENKPLSLFLVICIIIIGEILNCDYGWFGITIIFLFHIFKNKKLFMNLSFITIILIKYGIAFFKTLNTYNIYFALFTCLSLIFINLYNNKKGKNMKYLLYLFYPLHLIVLYLINFLMLSC